jgi:hypothetical protein
MTPPRRLTSVLWLAVLAGLSGCVAETVQKRKPRKGPIAAVGYIDTGGGEVRYSTDGWRIAVYLRRRSALHKMRRVCRGKDLEAKIVDEWTHEDADPIYAGEDLDENMERGLEHFKVASYHHISYDCRLKEKPLTKPPQDKPK